ncbi:hypothetical protein CDD81_4367 [Ophiocordyceps australis]|uniref:Uncharacterized protein n=1 Tax=Ophiocordyceps australis TaxID=1399860 RepID=A0A2C5XQT9_9HYPO|nr:hypothetical protein CDD81_4367 [Ophiocordyceps australis]
MNLDAFLTILFALGARGQGAVIRVPEMSEVRMRQRLAELQRSITIDMDNLPKKVFQKTEDTSYPVWFLCSQTTFTETQTFVQGRHSGFHNVSGTYDGLDITIDFKPQKIRESDNSQSNSVSLTTQTTAVDIDSTTSGWTFGAQLHGSSLSLGLSSISTSQSYSSVTTTGKQFSVTRSSTFQCPSGFRCWSEIWPVYLKISGRCESVATHQCAYNVHKTCSERTIWDYPQFLNWRDRVCPPKQSCEVQTPVMNGNEPYIVEVFFEKPIKDFHKKPEITGYKAGCYQLGSDDYLYCPPRPRNLYWSVGVGYHDHNIFPNLDVEVASFKHNVPKIVKNEEDCYFLDTDESYYPWKEGEKQYYVEGLGYFAKPTASAPTDLDIADYLDSQAAKLPSQEELEESESFTNEEAMDMANLKDEIHIQYLKLFKRHAKLETGMTSTDAYGQTSLTWAVINGLSMIVQLCLENGADATAKDKAGRTPLLWAVINEHVTIATRLLDMYGVDLNQADHLGRTPLSLAVHSGSEVMVEKILATPRVDPNAADQNGRTPLMMAAEKGHEGIFRMLMGARGINPDAEDKAGRTPLMFATISGHEVIVKLLLDSMYVSPNSKDQFSQTALGLAALNGRATVVRLLLSTGRIDSDTKDVNGATPLSLAAAHASVETVKAFVDKGGVHLDAQDVVGRTPLLLAVEKGNLATAKYLLDIARLNVNALKNTNRINVTATTNTAQGAMALAAANKHQEMVEMLLGCPRIPVDDVDKWGRTPLYWAALRDQKRIVKMLLDTARVNPFVEDNDRRQMLSWVLQKKNRAMYDVFKEAGTVTTAVAEQASRVFH